MNKYLLGGAIAATLAAMTPAIGQAPAPAPVAGMGHDQGDAGWKGRAMAVKTRAEVAAHVRMMFAKLDSNRDGSITKVEAEAAKASHGDRAGQHMPDGAMGDRRGMFDRMDANHDGTISRGEFDAMHHGHDMAAGAGGAPGGMKHGGMGGMGGMKHGGMGGMGGGMGGMGGRMFDMADANRDGRVTLQEATNAALRHFDTADLNRDGQLTPQERMQMHQRMRSERRPG